MQKLYKVLEKTQAGDKMALQHLMHQFEPKINSLTIQTKTQNRNDLKQELYTTLIRYSKIYHLDGVPGYDEFRKNILFKR